MTQTLDNYIHQMVNKCHSTAHDMPRPVVFEALWDGDTQGWFLELYMSNDRERRCVAILSFGGDSRLFNGQVPPWPEAVVAREVGRELATDGVRVWFPSPDHPDDECPNWHQRDQAIRCDDCGKVILPRSSPYIPRELCHNCHRARRGKVVAAERAAALKVDQPPPEDPHRAIVLDWFVDGEPNGTWMYSQQSEKFRLLLEAVQQAAPEHAEFDRDQAFDEEAVSRIRAWVHAATTAELEGLPPVPPKELYRTNEHTWNGRTYQLFRIGQEHERAKALLSLSNGLVSTTMNLYSNADLGLREMHILNRLRRGVESVAAFEDEMVADFGDGRAFANTISRLMRRRCLRTGPDGWELTRKGQIVTTPETGY